MSVRWALLALLEQRPSYGYLLKQELHRRVDGWSINVGQVYNTLERLVRDGLVARAGESGSGQLLYRSTPRGDAELAKWWAAPSPATDQGGRERLTKVALAVSLPGVDALAVVGAELAELAKRSATVGRLSVVALARRAELRAQREWLEAVRDHLLRGELRAQDWTGEPGRRGRPPTAESSAAGAEVAVDAAPADGRGFSA